MPLYIPPDGKTTTFIPVDCDTCTVANDQGDKMMMISFTYEGHRVLIAREEAKGLIKFLQQTSHRMGMALDQVPTGDAAGEPEAAADV